jgi:hypothetical protein
MGEIVFIPDLSAYVCAFKWAVPLRAVGWLECPYPYAIGTAPLGLAEKLAALIAQPIIISMGCDVCSLCAESGTETTGFIWSLIVYIPGDAEVFVVPGGVVHYVESHTYLPPGRFIEAVFRCPDPDSPAYWAAMTRSNAGIEVPIRPGRCLSSAVHGLLSQKLLLSQ